MIAVLFRTLRDRWRMLLAVSVIGVGTTLMYVSLFPSYQDLLTKNQQLFNEMPEALLKAFNIESATFDTIEKFLTIEMYSLFWLVLAIILTLSLSGSSLAGEVERETVMQSLGQPISRSSFYLGKFLGAAKIFSAFNLVVVLSVFPFAAMFDVTVLPWHYLSAVVLCELFGLAFLGLGFAVSAWLSDKGKVYMALGGVVLVMYVLNIVSALLPKLEKLQYASLFHYFDPNSFLVRGEYALTSMLVFAGVAVSGMLIGWWRWVHRDLI